MSKVLSGSLSSLNSELLIDGLDGFGTASVLVSGTWSGMIELFGSIDGITFVPISAENISTSMLSNTTQINGQFRLNISGLVSFKTKMTSYSSGSASIYMKALPIPGMIRAVSSIVGGTDGTIIGNIGDKLKTNASVTLSGGTSQSWSTKLRYDDMNVSNGGLVRGTSITAASGWNQAYSYTGSGALIGFILNIETKDDWAIRLVADNEELFGANGILSTDIHSDAIYDADPSGKSIPETDQDLGLFFGSHDRIIWSGPLLIPVRYENSIKIYFKRSTGAATKKFNAGLVINQKET